jgi:hypothetical protein
MSNILGPTGSGRKRRTLIGASVTLVVLSVLVAQSAFAVHDENFQLDGDVLASTTTNVGGTTQTVDWDSLINADGTVKSSLPAGFGEASFDKDFTNNGTSFVNTDSTTFATGSKDTLPISGWQCNFDNNVNNKIDVVNAYAATYTATSGDEILYFALERFTNTGTADVGFWFLQSSVACESSSGTATFSGEHTDGDLLIVSEFTGGGTVSTVNVYRWNGGANGTLGTTPVASGVDCRSTTTTIDDPACGAANRQSITTPWLTAAFTQSPKVGHTLPTAQFFEGGVNLTDSHLGGKCFATFLGDTRSSASLTATLFDFSGGELGQCVPGMTTQASTNGTVAPGTAVTDSATITVTGADNPDDPTGDVTFFLCGPIAASADCSTGGTNIGTGTLNGGANTTDGIATATSPEVNTPTSVTGNLGPGHYCFRAEWPGDLNYGPASHTDSTLECFNVKDTTAIATTQSWLPQDAATISTGSGAPAPAGTVVFSLYLNGTCSGTAATTFTDGTAPYSTDNATYVTTSTIISWSATFTPTDANAFVGSTTTACERSDLTINNSAGPFPPTP